MTKFNHFEGLNSQTDEIKKGLKLVTWLKLFSTREVTKSCFSSSSFTPHAWDREGRGEKNLDFNILNLTLVSSCKHGVERMLQQLHCRTFYKFGGGEGENRWRSTYVLRSYIRSYIWHMWRLFCYGHFGKVRILLISVLTFNRDRVMYLSVLQLSFFVTDIQLICMRTTPRWVNVVKFSVLWSEMVYIKLDKPALEVWKEG